MPINEDEVKKGLECCVEYLCGECPYEKYDIKGKPLVCVHKLMEDLHKIIGGENNACE